MSSESLQRIQATFGAISQLPYCSGVVPLDPSMSTLFYTKNGKVQLINFTNVTNEQLAALAETCQQATFGVNDKDVLDESYRKAGKLDAIEFATQFSPLTTGVVETVNQQLLSGAQLEAGEGVRVELYKLNVYGMLNAYDLLANRSASNFIEYSKVLGHFSKHTSIPPGAKTCSDLWSLCCPQSTKEDPLSFATLAKNAFLIQPKPYILRKNLTLPLSRSIATSSTKFPSSRVTSGYRVTLTYNLYVKNPSEATSISPLTSNVNPIEEMKHELKKLLEDPSFLPNGGYLGFGLSHRYPFKPSRDSIYQLDKRLKGSDAEVKRMCKALGLNVTLKAIYCMRNPGNNLDMPCCLVDHFIRLGDQEIEYSLYNYICRTEDNAILVVPSEMPRQDLGFYDLEEADCRSIVWIKPFAQTNNDFMTKYIAYGNEAEMGYAYGDVCLVAEVRLGK